MNAVHCTIAGRQEMPPFLHVLYTNVKALTFVFKDQLHLEALMYGNRACELFTCCISTTQLLLPKSSQCMSLL